MLLHKKVLFFGILSFAQYASRCIVNAQQPREELRMYPRLMHLYGPIWIYSYGTMIALGFLLFLLFAYQHPTRKRLMSTEQFFNTLFVGFLSGIIGGRLLFVITHLDTFVGNWIEIFFPWEGGFTLLGGIVGVVIAVPLYVQRIGIPILQVLDIAALYAPLMQAIARFGCLFAGCCYGSLVLQPTTWNSITFSDPAGFAPCGVPLYPTQIYMSIASLFIFFLMIGLSKIKYLKPGQLIFSYLLVENFARFAVDFWRGDREFMYYLLVYTKNEVSLSQPQVLSLVFCCIAFIGLLWTTARHHHIDA